MMPERQLFDELPGALSEYLQKQGGEGLDEVMVEVQRGLDIASLAIGEVAPLPPVKIITERLRPTRPPAVDFYKGIHVDFNLEDGDFTTFHKYISAALVNHGYLRLDIGDGRNSYTTTRRKLENVGVRVHRRVRMLKIKESQEIFGSRRSKGEVDFQVQKPARSLTLRNIDFIRSTLGDVGLRNSWGELELGTHLSMLDLDNRLVKTLKRNALITTVGELQMFTERQLLGLRHFGEDFFRELLICLVYKGIIPSLPS